jgi:predicted amidohydrolase YtcJ
MAYANSLGLTGIHDEGGTNFPNSSSFNTFSDYDVLMALRNEDAVSLRMRIQHVVYDKDTLDDLLEQKLNNTWQGFGDDMIKYWTVGEHIVTFPMNGKVNPVYLDKVTKVAKDGWTHEQHSVNFEENKQHLAAIKQANEKYPIENLRWTLSHVFELGNPKTLDMIVDVKRLKMGLRVQNHGYYTRTDVFPLGRNLKAEQSGPLFKTLLEQDISMGAGTDGPLLGPMNPWFSIYYMVTGKDVTGKLVNSNETISRMDALRLYTLGNAWMSFEEQKLGSLEVGKLADLVVLNQDFFSVSDENIKNIKAILTIVDGKIVYENIQ